MFNTRPGTLRVNINQLIGQRNGNGSNYNAGDYRQTNVASLQSGWREERGGIWGSSLRPANCCHKRQIMRSPQWLRLNRRQTSNWHKADMLNDTMRRCNLVCLWHATREGDWLWPTPDAYLTSFADIYGQQFKSSICNGCQLQVATWQVASLIKA